jgi:hypothetical protein
MINTQLRNRILACLSSGGLTTPELAAQLNQPAKAIARMCGAMEKNHQLTHSGRYKRYRWHLPATAPPETPSRRGATPLPAPPLKIIHGITPDDLEWMERYRRKAAQRSARCAL